MDDSRGRPVTPQPTRWGRVGERTAFAPPPADLPARPGGTYAEPQAMLMVRRGPTVGEQFPLLGERPTILGRHSGCDIVLPDATVSRRHAEIRREDGQFVLVDAGSLNGTYLNREPAVAAVLADGDDIAIGIFRLTFRSRPVEPGN